MLGLCEGTEWATAGEMVAEGVMGPLRWCGGGGSCMRTSREWREAIVGLGEGWKERGIDCWMSGYKYGAIHIRAQQIMAISKAIPSRCHLFSRHAAAFTFLGQISILSFLAWIPSPSLFEA